MAFDTVSNHDDPWVIARDQYIADLSDEERRLFTHATLENLFQDSSDIQNSHEQKSQSRALMSRLKPFISAIEDYGSALDVFSNIYPLVLAPIWGTLRVILHLARKFNKIFDRIVDVFQNIGWVIPRFREYERAFGKHPRIIQALSSAYLDIVNECSEIKAFIRSIQKAKIKSFTKLFSPLDHHLSDLVGRFWLHREDVQMEAEACHMIESAKHYDLELRDREVAALERKSQLRRHLLHLLSPIDSADKQRKVLKIRQEGTGNWLLENNDFNTWKNWQKSSVLSIFGIPGSGKTILSSCTIDELQETASERVAIIYHYCDYRDSRSLNPSVVAGTLISGLLESLDIPDDLSSLITHNYQDGQRAPDEAEIRQILDFVLDLRLDHTIFVVLDGVDEVQEQDRKVLFDFVKYLTDCKHSLLDAGVDINATTQRKMPLTIAITQGLTIVKILIDHGADVDGDEAARQIIGWPASFLCRVIRMDQVEIVELFISVGVNLFAEAGWGRSKTTPELTALKNSKLPAAMTALNSLKVVFRDQAQDHVASDEADAGTRINNGEDEIAINAVANSQADIRVDPEERTDYEGSSIGSHESQETYDGIPTSERNAQFDSDDSGEDEDDDVDGYESDHLQESVFHRAPP